MGKIYMIEEFVSHGYPDILNLEGKRISRRESYGVDVVHRVFRASTSRVTTWSSGGTLTAAALNGEFNAMLNGGINSISNANIASDAAIATSKINVTFPSGTIVGSSDTQTLTNKTLTSPVINVGSDAQGDLYYRNSSGVFARLAPGTSGQFLKTNGAAQNPEWAALATTKVVGFSQDVASATFNATATKVCAVSVTLAVTSSVIVMASMDAYYSTANYEYRLFIKRDGTTKTTGPYNTTQPTNVNRRAGVSTSFVESGLAAGTYEYQLFAQNTTDNNGISTGDVVISVLAIG